FGVEPQVVLDVVIGGPVRSAKLESMSASVPGHVVFELIAFLMLLIRKKCRPAERGAAPRPYCAKAVDGEVHTVVVQGDRLRPVAGNDLNQHLVDQSWADGARPGA